jgi:heat shock protein HslJ
MAQGRTAVGVVIVAGLSLLAACTHTAPRNDINLSGTIWNLLLLDDNNSLPGGRPTLSFTEDGRITGYAGCNSYFGQAWISRDRIRFLDVGSHLTACEPRSAMDLEPIYHQALVSIRFFRVESGKLVLLDAKQTPRLVFKPGEDPRLRNAGRPAVIAHPVSPGAVSAITPYASMVAGSTPSIQSSGAVSAAQGRFAGFELVTVTPGLGRYFGTDRGALVARVPIANSTELQEGDVIVSVNGRRAANGPHGVSILSSYQPGETLTIDIMRDQKPMTVQVTLQ